MKVQSEIAQIFFDVADVVIVVIGKDGNVRFINRKGCELLGYEEKEIAGKNWFDNFIPGANRKAVKEAFDKLMAGGVEPVEYFENPVVARGGGERLIAWHNSVIRDEHGGVQVTVSSGEDVTDKRKTEQALRESAGKLRAMLESIGDHMSMMDKDLNILWANDIAKNNFGDDIIGRKCYAAYHGRKEPCEPYPCLTLKAFRDGKIHEHDTVVTDKDGNPVYFHCTANVAVRDGEGRPTAVMEISRDVTAAKRAEDALRHQATYDTLTNLPNRKFFMDRVQNAIDLEQRYGGRKFAVAFLDLDRFKLINDSLGHSAGDELLVSVAERLKNNSRSSDTVARLGGDEFAILIESITSQEDALTAAERMQRYVSEPYQLGDHEVFTSPSIGIVLGNGSYKSPEEMLRDADNAMYQAKSSGRACCRVFDSAMHRQSFNRLSMEADLRRALEADEFRVHYQPILSLVTGEVVAAEALVRWQHPGRGMVSPSEFIPIAEETGLIVPIGEWVLRTACAQYKSWEEAGHEGLRMAVNFSAKQFQTGNVRDCIARVLDQTGVGAHALNLEITESIAVSPDERVIDMLKGVSAMGSWICLDDFGTGYSSLSTLKHLPISCLKLDRIFIGDIPGNEEATDLCRAIIAMAHVLKLNVVAEGVETVEQLEFLRGVGCDEAQGFLFSRPVVPGDFSMLLGKGRELFQTPSRGA